MSDQKQAAAASATQSWLHELAEANATLPTWLLLVFLIAGLTGFVVGLLTLFAS